MDISARTIFHIGVVLFLQIFIFSKNAPITNDKSYLRVIIQIPPQKLNEVVVIFQLVNVNFSNEQIK